MIKKSALGIFFKIPVLGKVKKRLAAEIGEDKALKAYESMLRATIENVSGLRGIDICGFYEGERASLSICSSSFNSPSTSYDLTKGAYRVAKRRRSGFTRKIPLISQKGSDLGEKMYNAIKWLFSKGYKKVSLIGADSPDLPLAFIIDAFEKLNSYKLVIGPSEDGGYYLIGMNKPYDSIFKDIQWGHDSVLKDTISNANAAGISYFLLPEWYDIDDRNSFDNWKMKNLAR
jgi:rSAM/selenodomain-associated transferase 1